eukprot:TRINITY_DN14201_c0_g1_i1.p1 TRINITY_DN14201_c0_g1~~TRINITY_DN14201_c0_g1_i1.p1  ORF type:complete len:411 (+),score=42.76 TRINITY_DN14201_c0_g1_i1:52-1284(+)
MTMSSKSPLFKSIAIIILGQVVWVSCIRGKKTCSLSGEAGEDQEAGGDVSEKCKNIAMQINRAVDIPYLNEDQEGDIFEQICRNLQTTLSRFTRRLFGVEFTDLAQAGLEGGDALSRQITVIVGNINGWFHKKLVRKVTKLDDDNEREQAKDQNFSNIEALPSSIWSKIQDWKTIDGIEALAAFFTRTGLFFESGKRLCLKMIHFLVQQFLSRMPFVHGSSMIERSIVSTGGNMTGERADIEHSSDGGLMSSYFIENLQSVFEGVLTGSAAYVFFSYNAATFMSAINAVIKTLISSQWNRLLRTFFTENTGDGQREQAWKDALTKNIVPQLTRYICKRIPLDKVVNASSFNFSWLWGDDPDETTQGEAQEYKIVEAFVTQVMFSLVKYIILPIQTFMNDPSGGNNETAED